ncbi:hypothetical protein [Metabacillus sp. 84]|uniref:UPF0738 family protein n=1 Tax=unclassified Metabacillus TaxID=2675274 RepID=UPI003CF2BD97
MNKRIEVIESGFESGKLVLKGSSYDGDASALKAKGQILADSDHLAFIYILEDAEQFTYFSIPAGCWAEIEKARAGDLSVWASINQHELELEEFFNELRELVQNIAGNANYGDEMEGKVSEVFASLA